MNKIKSQVVTSLGFSNNLLISSKCFRYKFDICELLRLKATVNVISSDPHRGQCTIHNGTLPTFDCWSNREIFLFKTIDISWIYKSLDQSMV